MPADVWTHVAVTRVGTAFKLYIDGTLAASGTSSEAFDFSPTATYIGKNGWDGAAGELNAYIDDFRITKGLARYTSDFTPPISASPIGLPTPVDVRYSQVALLINADGAAVVDESTPAKTLSSVGLASLSSVDSKVGSGGLYFNGAGSYFSTPHNTVLSLAGSDFTIEAWVNTNTIASVRSIIRKGVSVTYDTGYFAGLDATGKPFIRIGVTTGNEVFVSSTAVTAGSWNHVAFTKEGTTVRVFLNGTSVASGTLVGAFADNTDPLVIGNDPANADRDWFGYMDAIRITNGTARYTTGFTAPNYILASSGLSPIQGQISIEGQIPSITAGTTQSFSTVTGGSFLALASIVSVVESNSVTGSTFAAVPEIYGGAIVAGSGFAAIPSITYTATNTAYVTGNGFNAFASIVASHAFPASVTGRSFAAKATVIGGALVTGGAFKASLVSAVDVPERIDVSGRGFVADPVITAVAPTTITVTGNSFVAQIFHSQVTGRGFIVEPIISFDYDVAYAEAFVMNLALNEKSVTRYQNYPFNHLARIGNTYYGINENGLYELTGEYDLDEGTLVNGTIHTHTTDYGVFNSKNVPYVYLNGDDDYSVTAYVDDVEQPAFSSGFGGRRVKLARGNKGRYWEFKVEGIKKLQGIEHLPDGLSRRVK
jgi:hypothetical protein